MAVTKSAPHDQAAANEPAAAIAAAKTSAKRTAAKRASQSSERGPEKAPAKSAKPAASKASPEWDATVETTEKVKSPAKPRVATKAAKPAATDADSTPRPVSRKTATGPKKSAKTATPAASRHLEAADLPDQQEIDRMIAEAAYYLAEKRHFAPGWEQEDWETARRQVMARLQQRDA